MKLSPHQGVVTLTGQLTKKHDYYYAESSKSLLMIKGQPAVKPVWRYAK